MRPTVPRLPALQLDEFDDRQRQLVGLVDPQFTTVPNAVLTLVRDPALYEAFLPLATKLLIDSAFSVRHRELVILRTAVLVDSHYEWGQHVVLARDEFTDDDFRRIVAGADAPGWNDIEAARLRAVDELHEHAGISDATWTQLAAGFDEHQLVQLPFTASRGHQLTQGLARSWARGSHDAMSLRGAQRLR